MDKFLLAENPMVEGNSHPLYIFHSQQPVMLIQVHHEAIVFGDDNRLYFIGNHQNLDGVIETISLSIALLSEPVVSGELKVKINKVLSKAWHWYVTYLNWEDAQI